MDQVNPNDSLQKAMNETLLLERSIKLNRRRIIMDLIIVVMFLFGIYYIYSNIEFAKSMNGDVCRICEAKTGGLCKMEWTNPNALEERTESVDLNLSEISP